MSRQIHANSLAAFDEIEDVRSERANVIYTLLISVGVAMTDRQVAQALGFSDMNMARPRITELKEHRWAVETGTIECPVTRRHVRLVKALTAAERASLIESQRRRWQAQHSKPSAQLSLFPA